VSKLQPLNALPSLLAGKKIVHAHGCFDLVHPGHIEHFRQAKAMGDVLVVTITADKFVNKGPGRPVFTQEQRASHLASLEMVDYVAIVDAPTALPAIEIIKPAVYVKGPDYLGKTTPNFIAECDAVREYGGEIRWTSGFSSSSSVLINTLLPRPPEIQGAIQNIKDKYGAEGVLSWLDKAKDLTALVIGEAITDEYVFVIPEGKSSKESLVCFREIGREKWRGGANIVASHIGQLCHVETKENNPITKTRFLLEPFKTKLFHYVDSEKVTPLSSEIVYRGDMVAVADFGHGAISKEFVLQVSSWPVFVALTVQSNSLNYGFNLLKKWPKADYVVCDAEELRLNYGDKETPLIALAQKERERFGAKLLAVTQGHKGCMVVSSNGGILETIIFPALAEKVVDTMGAGDAFLGITAPLACAGAPADVIAFVGSVASAIEVGMVGNMPVESSVLRKWIGGILK